MTVFDYAVFAVVALSVVLGAFRGAVREVMHLVGWVAAFVLATGYAPAASAFLPAEVSHPGIRLAAAFLALFLATLLLAVGLALLLGELVKSAGLRPADRAAGAGFGLLRGGVIVVAGVLLAGLTTLPQERFWKQALLSGPLEAMALRLAPLLPDEVARRIRYE